MKLIKEGAEAKIYLEKNKIIKDRIRKSYRIKEIDASLRKSRTKTEERLLRRAKRNSINVPKVIDLKDCVIEMEYVDGTKVSEMSETKIFQKIGKEISQMHNSNIVHGDLTTSNMIFKNNQIYLIDFGLGTYSEKIEDKAVDLHVLKECLTSKHFDISRKAWKEFLKSYKNKDVLKRLEKVENRGKYKKNRFGDNFFNKIKSILYSK